MESPLICVVILLLNVLEFSSGIVYNRGDLEKRFACSSKGTPKNNEMIKLFLSAENLKIQCFFQTDSEYTSRVMLRVFTSGGLAPSLAIINSTYYGIFHFNLTLFSDQDFWLIDIPRENITENLDVTAVEQWLVRITLHQGLNIYTTEGTLLDIVREPILQWTLGNTVNEMEVQALFPHVTGLKVTKSPCANDVALLGFILNTTHNGVFIGLTSSGFWRYEETTWYDLTDTIYSQLREEHTELSVIDMVLANHFLVILTSLGLFVSTDLRYPTNNALKLSRADFCGFERVDYVKGKLWYNERCFANKERFEVDYVTITFDRNRTLSEASSCFYSKEPFLEWLPCLPHVFKGAKTMPSVQTFLIDQERNNGVYLFYDQSSKIASVSVNILKDNQPSAQPKFPPFYFPPSFSPPIGMVFHPRSNFLYAYGKEVWLSADGGNTFEIVADDYDGVVRNTYHSFYTSDVTFVDESSTVYLMKAGLKRYSKLGQITDKIFTLYYDHLGFIHKLTPDRFDAGKTVEAFGTSKSIFGKLPDLGFETALAPQYLSPKEMLFFAYLPLNSPQDTTRSKKFHVIHQGKVIHFSKKGKAFIRKIFTHDTPAGFSSSVIAELVDPFGLEEAKGSSCLSSSLSIEETGNVTYRLVLDAQNANAAFQDTDIEKTVVIPGFSSFLITEILDSKNALSLATMPRLIPKNVTLLKDTWFLYNFGQKNGRLWTIYTKPCNYLFQLFNDLLPLNFLQYVDVGDTETIKVKIIPNTKGMRTLDVPPLQVIVGNPSLLETKVEGAFDSTDSYIMVITAASHSLRQGSISLELVMWEASTDCFVSTVVPTLKSSCSYLRSLRHTPSKLIPLTDWISGIHLDSKGFNMIKTLPVNYRPPSNMGIAIPLTDNFYHADPSKPIPRNLFHKSKATGKYKQCANVSTREECNCTNDQKFSHAVAFSDCKEKVPRFKFPVTQYQVSLEIFSEDGIVPVKPTYLVTITEVNMRENWELKHIVTQNIKKMKDYLEPMLRASVYNPFGLNLSIRGSELFHFRVSVVPGVTFCNYVEEFQIYVDEVPLPFPGHSLIAVAAAVVLGGLIFTSFMFQLRNVHPCKTFKKWLRRHKVNLSNISVT